MTTAIIIGSVCFFSGFGFIFLLRWRFQLADRRLAEAQGQDLIREAQEIAESEMSEAKARAEEHQDSLQDRFERDFHDRSEKVIQHEEALKDLEKDLQARVSSRQDVVNKKKSLVDKHAELVGHKEKRFQRFKDELKALQERWTESLKQKSSVPTEELLTQMIGEVETEAQLKASREKQVIDADVAADAERTARKIIQVALNRFARPYCEERGIGYVYFANEKVRDRVLGPERRNLRILEQACGVDMIFNEEMNSVSVSGFDPVRRELGRATLEKLCNERDLNETRILHLVDKTKKDLFRKIRNDGQKMAAELKLKSFHPEVINMMGALRYRYSFAQNQYFHCAEVGFLCGLLSAELKLNVIDGRRAGLLHDIGKAMDHSLEGGHAVIGADFIQKHGEEAHIVHAVRAHHFDETPTTDLAYLVIAADAISGARPGARRSTADSYIQKMGQLESIGNSFQGVIQTYILSAGREVRVIVDSHRIDDQGALRLSKEIAKKIEEECSYPGLIKVTVVRETQAVDVAK